MMLWVVLKKNLFTAALTGLRLTELLGEVELLGSFSSMGLEAYTDRRSPFRPIVSWPFFFGCSRARSIEFETVNPYHLLTNEN